MTNSNTPDANMTSPSSPHTVVEDIDQYLAEGLAVFDANGDRVGTVKMYSTAAGYLIVGSGPVGDQNLYIPFRLIRSIDPGDIYLTLTKDTLEAQYTQPPKITTVSETRLVPGPQGALTPQTTHVQMVQSGYDDKQTTVSRVDVSAIAQQLAIGMAVFDAEGEHIGDITQYDVSRSLMAVEKGIFKPTVLFVPFGAIQSVDPYTLSVYLSVPRDVIVKEHAMQPAQGYPAQG